MTISSPIDTSHIARRVDKQGARPSVGCQAGVEKRATGRPEDRLLRCKKVSLVSTFNCRTLSTSKSIGELTSAANRYGIDVVCIQEHRIFHEGIDIKHHDMKNGWKLLTSSAEKAQNNSTIRGVGMLVSPKAYKSLNSIESVNPRILIASFNGNPAVTIISCYSPTNVALDEDKDKFYKELTLVTRAIPKHNVLLIGGDFNSKIGTRDATGSVFNDSTNENGQRLLDYLQECRLIALNTKFRKRLGQVTVW